MAARRGGVNSTAALPASTAASNGSLQYTCYLCHKRKSLMIKRCPIAKDGCHVACVTLPTPCTRSPPPPVTALGGSGRDAADCYVMKVHPDGSWVVVDMVSCRKAAPACYLTCKDGDEPGQDGAAGTTPAAPRAALPSLLADFERCGDHATAQGAAVPAI
ncbi:unnamed protein product [Miscanthus lutarioriparius]|uniref:Uncharacterized protein n=1 Tax=Miscanthus lutarioriparius TaxID=422564 RepID=A0A811SEX8_9POAL|nr:unnamed protein product [Miscanthus lutarioriparius]